MSELEDTVSIKQVQTYLATTFLAGMPELTVKQQDYITGKIKELGKRI